MPPTAALVAQREARIAYAPAMVISAILMVGETVDDRHTRSLPIISIELNISLRFPAMVTSCTGIGQLAVLDPDPTCAARVVAGHHVHAEADLLGEIQTLFDRADDLLGRIVARHQGKVCGAHSRWRTHRARGIAGRREIQLARRIAVEQIGLQLAFLDQVLAIGRQSFAIERFRARPAEHPRVIDQGNIR